MKKILLVSVLLLFAFSSFGQKIRFTDSTNKWDYYLWTPASTPYFSIPFIDSFSTDTFILGNSYKGLEHDLFTSPFFSPAFAYIREDTISKKIFAIATFSPDFDTSEQLLYDFSLNIGDTFKSKHAFHFVIGIDSVLINSIWHKVWHLFPYSADSTIVGLVNNEYFVVEGIGCVHEPFFPLRPFSFEAATDLTCFNNRGITPLLSHPVGYFDNGSSCSLTFGLGLHPTNDKINSLRIAPNPIDYTSKITFPYNISSGSLTVFNGMGQTVLTLPFQNKEEILIGDKIKLPGIYYYRVNDNENGNVYSGKFVKQ